MKASKSNNGAGWSQSVHYRALRKLSWEKRWRGCIGLAVQIDPNCDIPATLSKLFARNEFILWIVVQDIPAFATADKKNACWATLPQARAHFGMPFLPPEFTDHLDLLHNRGKTSNRPPKNHAAFAAVSMVMSRTAQVYRRAWRGIEVKLPVELRSVPIQSCQFVEFLPRPFVAIRTMDYETLIKFLLHPIKKRLELKNRSRIESRIVLNAVWFYPMSSSRIQFGTIRADKRNPGRFPYHS